MTEAVAVPLTATPDPVGAGATAAAVAALRRPRSWPEWLGAGAPFAAGLLLVWPWLTARLGWSPACLVRERLGVPCPFCRGIRAGRALLELDVPAALVANPLAVALAITSAVMLVVWVLRLAGVVPGPRRWSRRSSRRAGGCVTVGLAVGWLYQLVVGG